MVTLRNAVALVLLLVGVDVSFAQATGGDVIQTNLRPVVSEIVSPTVRNPPSFVGVVKARVETNLGFPLSGTLAARPVDVGDTVARDDILAQLDPEKISADVWAAKAGVVVAEQQVKSAKDAVQRIRELVARGVDEKARLEEAERALAAAQARLKQAQATLARAEDVLRSATLHAPQDGIITAVFSDAGAAVSAGQPVVRLAATVGREIIVDLTEPDIKALPPNARFDTRLLADPEIQTGAQLTTIDPVADSATRTRRLHLTPERIPGTYRLGALVKVIPVGSDDRQITLPVSSLLKTGNTYSVWRIERPSGQIQRIPVKTGGTLGDRIQILSGLETGDEILVKGIHSIQDGQIVGPRVSQ